MRIKLAAGQRGSESEVGVSIWYSWNDNSCCCSKAWDVLGRRIWDDDTRET